MSSVIYKIQFDIQREHHDVELPIDVEFLTVHEQHRAVTLWYRWNLAVTATNKHRFFIVGTGWTCPGMLEADYIGTAFCGAFVWHLFHKRLS